MRNQFDYIDGILRGLFLLGSSTDLGTAIHPQLRGRLSKLVTAG